MNRTHSEINASGMILSVVEVLYRSGTTDREREYYDRQQIRGDTHNRG